jgi:hypothetical protein
MKPFVSLLLVFFCVVRGSQLGGQSAADVSHAPDGGISEHVDGIFIPGVSGAPFSAKVVVEITSHLQDGATVARKYYTQVARDSQGRMYREDRGILAADSDREPPLLRTYVSDPLTRLRTMCSPAQRTCWITNYHPILRFTEAPAGPAKDGRSFLVRDRLGSSTIDDLEVQGTRETLTFNANTFGNDRPVSVTKEFWYSPRLQINLTVTRNDPRTGNQKLQVTELSLSDPDPRRFAIAEGYKMIDERQAASTGGR